MAINGNYALCMRVESQRPAQGSAGGWIHRLADAPGNVAFTPRQARSTIPLAPIERRDRIYRQMQARLGLSATDRLALLARGYTAEQVTARGYRSFRLQQRARLAIDVCGGYYDDLRGVPGFWRQTGWTLAGSPGLLIPCLDVQQRIRAYRIRPYPRDGGEDRPKYIWLSSARKPEGTGSGAHCHVARPSNGIITDPAVYVTEGEIKADIAADRLGAIVVSIPGVSSWAAAIPDLVELLPAGGNVVIALDADWRTKPAVHDAIWYLCQTCNAIGYGVEVALWELNNGKGLDDLLVAGHAVSRSSAPGAVPMPEWKLKVTARFLAELPARKAVTAPPLLAVRKQLPSVLESLYQSRPST